MEPALFTGISDCLKNGGAHDTGKQSDKKLRWQAGGGLRGRSEVAEGEVFGLLGPNGAGKTTTMEMIEGLRKPDVGEIHLFGVDALRKPKAG